MTVDEVKAKVIAALGDCLGRYRSDSGIDEPAIWIRPPLPPDTWSCSGLEVVITHDPRRSRIDGTSGDNLSHDYWTLRLVQWDQTQTTRAAVERIQRAIPGVQPPRTTEADGLTFEQTILEIYDPAWTGRET